jgi:hypothetical protein
MTAQHADALKHKKIEMIKILFAFFLLMCGSVFQSKSQTAERSVINSCGSRFSNAYANMDFNIGEPFTTHIGNEFNYITQGFLQPEECDSGNIEICDGIDNNGNGMTDELLNCGENLQLTLFIGGFYSGNRMLFSPVDYDGSPVTDSVTVELASPYSCYRTLHRVTGAINTNGTGSFQFNNVQGQSFYIVIKHRSSLVTWSKNPVLFNSSIVSYDFSE